MEIKRVDLYKEFNIKRTDERQMGYLNCYISGKNECTENIIRPAMLVIAGGAYAFVSAREMEPVALSYLKGGFNAFTLEYSVAPCHYPDQLLEACMAMIYIRENADEFNVDKEHIASSGFSAGGHLCASLSTIWNEKEIKDILKDKTELARPDASVFAYPVITSGPLAHRGSIDNVTGGNNSLNDKLSLEKRVTKDSVPAFIWSTVTDNVVPCENAIMMAMAYRKNNVPFELHVFAEGNHGLSIATEETGVVNKPVSVWVDLSLTWLKNRGFVIKEK